MAPSQKNATPTADPLVGTRLGDYEIRRLIGRGGMARVYEGYDPNLERRAAIKVITPQAEDSEEIKQRFFREARAVANLRHPNIVTVYQFGQGKNLYYFAMELLEGQTLLQTLERLRAQKKFVDTELMLSVASDVSAALDYAHAKGVIHRDVKPSNIMIGEDKRAILMDFGLLMHVGGEHTLGTAFGTPRYIAPEQAVSSDRAVPQSDIYSLGVVVYEMATGQTPFDADSAMSLALLHISAPPPAPRTIRPELSEAVEQVILKALEKNPEARWQSATQFANALRDAFSGRPMHIKLSNEICGAAALSADPSPTRLLSTSHVAVPTPTPKPTTISAAGRGDSTLREANPSRTLVLRQREKRASRTRLRSFLLLTSMIFAIAAALAYLLTLQATPPLLTGANRQFALPDARLVYSSDVFVVYNTSAQPLPLGELRFEQGNRVAAFPRNALLQLDQCAVIRTSATAPLPENCSASERPITLRGEASFWKASAAMDTFRVWRGDQLLALCSARLNTCEIMMNVTSGK
ncbi:MAG: serine/threonine protein kinase [Chloroflexi bacterium]|nr:serine/threonine protein kinase [Chloroflexota bacterium]